MLTEDLINILACPQCKGPLSLEDNALNCPECSLLFPIENDIPLLLIEKATSTNDK